MLEIVLCAFHWISERIVGLQDCFEVATITGVVIIGMIEFSKIAKNAFYRSRVGVRADFQDFVIVDEVRGFHHMSPHPAPSLFANARIAASRTMQGASLLSCMVQIAPALITSRDAGRTEATVV